MNLFSGPTDTRRTTQMILMGIIVLTLPCYCLGAVLLAYAPSEGTAAAVGSPTLGGITQTPRLTPTFTPFFTYTFTPYSGPLRPTAPPLYLPPTVPYYYYPTATPYPTFQPMPTSAPTLTLIPSPTLAPTSIPTDVPPPTQAPLPTEQPLPTDEPPPTQEVITNGGDGS